MQKQRNTHSTKQEKVPRHGSCAVAVARTGDRASTAVENRMALRTARSPPGPKRATVANARAPADWSASAWDEDEDQDEDEGLRGCDRLLPLACLAPGDNSGDADFDEAAAAVAGEPGRSITGAAVPVAVAEEKSEANHEGRGTVARWATLAGVRSTAN
jgi:hypothetical protein